jgi:phosphoribosyl-ATP pyrophosphohydrolase/phosphoribosyl-AMP cyclohydrolase
MTLPLPLEPAWNEHGLAPAIVQDSTRGTVLMLAWMNAEALERTRSTRKAWFWSRSRGALWQKGETSGNVLDVEEVRIDCDADAILVRARPAGPACHTGKAACFYRVIDGEAIVEDDGIPGTVTQPMVLDGSVIDRLFAVLDARRKSATAERSYTKSLLDAGTGKIADKIGEEARELIAEIPNGEPTRIVAETADLFYHVLVGLLARDIAVEEVWREMLRRFGTSGLVEKASR